MEIVKCKFYLAIMYANSNNNSKFYLAIMYDLPEKIR